MASNQLQVAGVDAHGHPVYIQPHLTPVQDYRGPNESMSHAVPQTQAMLHPQQMYVPPQGQGADDNVAQNDVTLGLDQQGIGRFILRHNQQTSQVDGHAKQHQAKSWLGGYGRFAEWAEAGFFLLIELFKITMACLLAIFVPQACLPLDGDPTLAFTFIGSVTIGGQVYNNVSINAPDYYMYNNITQTHECSIRENFIQLSQLNVAALVFNFLSWSLCVFHFYLLFKRERFFIDHFDYDPKKNRIHLRFQVTSYPRVESKLYRYNLIMFWTSIICIMFLTINMILSGVLVFRDYYLGTRTATVFITNCLLLGSTMTRTAESAFLGAHNNIALSSIEYEPISYNVVDEIYVKKRYGDDGTVKVELGSAQP